ncbi:glycosyltransferase [Brooklawnia cerclae]|uniref:Glycosyltransferase involved in cell wall biosynthesis n=2 Tax=Brooklawnia cerclae TaxID=349934 RepID=A0ABX0SFY3_9ACTN|nr:glycosyltransferase involved in cell wall biosynthesis [Brooklawnia cerclae]
MSGINLTGFSLLGSMRGNYDICHMHWPDWVIVPASPWQAYSRTFLLMISLAVRKARGTKIIWTVHNLKPHQYRSALRERILYTGLSHLVDHQIHLTEGTSYEMEHLVHPCRRTPSTVIPHGLLANPQSFPDKLDARLELGLEESCRIYLFFGGIDEYKGVDALIEAFRKFPDTGSRLIVVGKPSSRTIERSLENLADGDRRITLDLRFQRPSELRRIIAASDVVTLPYRTGLNSGSVYLALAARRRVLVPSTPTFEAVARQVGSGWVHTFRGNIASRDFERVAISSTSEPSVPHVPSWLDISEQTRALYCRLVACGS